MPENLIGTKKPNKMLEPQENNPEKMLPKGVHHLMMKILFILVLNVVVFGAIYGLVYLFFLQKNSTALQISSIVTILSLIVTTIYWIAKDKEK